MINLIKLQMKLLWKRKELYFVFYLLLAICIYAFVVNLSGIWYNEDSKDKLDVLYSFPAYANFIIHPSFHSYGLLYSLLILLICPLAFSDSYFVEKKNGIHLLIFTRVSKMKYLLSKAIIVYGISLIITAIPLLLNMAWNMMAFPLYATRSFTSQMASSDINAILSKLIYFSDFYFSHPYLYYLLFVFILSNFAASFSLAVFGISLIVKKYRVAVITSLFLITNLLMIVLNSLRQSGVLPNKDVTIVSYFMAANDAVKYPPYTSLVIFFMLILIFTVLFIREIKRSDEI